jgi:hypothetical protein
MELSSLVGKTIGSLAEIFYNLSQLHRSHAEIHQGVIQIEEGEYWPIPLCSLESLAISLMEIRRLQEECHCLGGWTFIWIKSSFFWK